jgi:hypothetical protein
MGEINVIFEGSLSITSNAQGKKPEREISLAQRIKTGRMKKWSNVEISFGLEDHLDTELSERNLPFVVMLPIGQHKVANTLIDNGFALNLIMKRTFIEMGLNLAELTPVHVMFHGVIPGQSSAPIGRNDLKVTCGIGDNKHMEMLTFEMASFNIGYNCFLGRPFLLMFMAVVYTAYATIKMPGPKGVIFLKSDQ